MGWERKRVVPALLHTLEGLRPTHLVVGTPLIPALRWGLLRAEPVLPHFSDSFSDMSWRARVTKRVLVQILNRRTIDVVANLKRPASYELVGIVVDPNKVVPRDWPSHMTPTGYPEKEAPDSTKEFSLVISSHPMFAQTLRAQPGLKTFDEGTRNPSQMH